MRCYYHIESSVCLVSFCPISHVSVSFRFSVWARALCGLMADLCVSWCLCHTTGVMHQWRCACWFTDVCNDAPAVIMMLLSSKYLNTCAILVVRFTLSLTSGFPHSQAKKSAPCSGAGNHDVQWHSLYRSRSGNNTFIEFIHSVIHCFSCNIDSGTKWQQFCAPTFTH